jgi:hypothetical protein
MPGGAGVDLTVPANREISKFFAAERARTEKAAQEVVQAALDFNQGKGPEAAKIGRTPHTPLVDGLFPKPAAGATITELTNRFAEQLVDRKDKPSVYAVMLRDILNAGEPVDPVTLGKQLDMVKAGQQQQLQNAGTVDKETQARLDQELLEARKRAHLSQASKFSIYAGLDCLPIEGAAGGSEGSTIPKSIPERPAAVSRAFQWQMDYWLIRDVFTAIRVANTTSGGTLAPVSQAVVKRLEKITIREPFAPPPPTTDLNDPNAAAAPAAVTLEQLAGLVPTDPSLSVTGRKSSPQNPLYDVRLVKLQMVVSTARMKELFNAFARTNFMTITDIDLKEVDVRGDLDKGFYYGPEAVLRATITVESVWLRGWTQDLFPSGVKKRLGLTLAEGEKPDDAEMASGTAEFGGPDPFGPQGGNGGGDAPMMQSGEKTRSRPPSR